MTTPACRICLQPTEDAGRFHPRCLKALFGAARPPRLDIDTGKLHTAALAMVGHTSLSGIQKKISLGLSVDMGVLTVVSQGGHYILKPQTGTYPSIPENEHVTTRMASAIGIETALSALVELSDGTEALLIRRFDRLPGGQKVWQEDFCQLAVQSPKDKYRGSAEQCVKILRQYATEPLIELRKLFRLLLFSWWSGNGDMHLKNFSLLVGSRGVVQLTPAYDLVCTQLAIADDPLALPVGGKTTKLARGDWLRLADYAGLPRRAAQRMIDEQIRGLKACLELIERSYLPPTLQAEYARLLEERTAQLG